VAERKNLSRFVCEQPPYSILTCGIETDVLPTTQRYGMGVISWSPLSGGYLSGRYRKGVDAEPSHRDRLSARLGRTPDEPGQTAKVEAAEALAELADVHGLTMVELSLAFVLNHPGITPAIIGLRAMDRLESQLSAPCIRPSTDATGSTRSSRPAQPCIQPTSSGRRLVFFP
jgi:aryl-alcohol dehydrogenase-like predicted oxidoreductase